MNGEPPVPEPAPEPIDVTAYGRVLLGAVDAALEPWVRSLLVRRAPSGAGFEASVPAVVADVAGVVLPPLGELLLADIDAQRSSPLALIRRAVPVLTAALDALGARPVERDPFAAEQFPDDRYDVTPATWGDLGEEVADAGLRWGAAKAFEHRRRHQR